MGVSLESYAKSDNITSCKMTVHIISSYPLCSLSYPRKGPQLTFQTFPVFHTIPGVAWD